MKLFFACLIVLFWLDIAQAQIKLVRVAQNLAFPLDVEFPQDSSNRMFIVLQEGKIVVHDGTKVLPGPFLDISKNVKCCTEEGLLSLAFHPNYKTNGLFFVYYVNTAGNLVLARYKASAQPNIANPATRRIILKIPHTQSLLHNGGEIQFGKDGYLYLSIGDGGTFGDPTNNAQNLGKLLGKLIRIDVNSGAPYAIPVDNPFVNRAGARKEIWAYGLRNPWRFSFDRTTGDLFIGDVGQEVWEEVNFQAASSKGGENYGWRKMEATHCYDPPANCGSPSFKPPFVEYKHTHSQGCAVTGGYVYRGSRIPALIGTYLYGDYCSGILWGAKRMSGKWDISQLLASHKRISSFGQDQRGELYVTDYSATGSIYRISRK